MHCSFGTDLESLSECFSCCLQLLAQRKHAIYFFLLAKLAPFDDDLFELALVGLPAFQQRLARSWQGEELQRIRYHILLVRGDV